MEFENSLNRLEKIVEKMEAGNLSLDESLAAFEEGIRLSKDCNKRLNQAEEKVKKLLSVDETGKAKTTDFESIE